MQSEQRPTFMGWLRQQYLRGDRVGDLAKTVRGDKVAARLSSAQELSRRLNQDEAGWEYHEALEEAEAEWCQLETA